MKLDKLLANAFPVHKVQFVKAVDNAYGSPEAGFDLDSNVPGRRVNMHLTPLGLLCSQGKQYFLVPLCDIVKIVFTEEVV